MTRERMDFYSCIGLSQVGSQTVVSHLAPREYANIYDRNTRNALFRVSVVFPCKSNHNYFYFRPLKIAVCASFKTKPVIADV